MHRCGELDKILVDASDLDADADAFLTLLRASSYSKRSADYNFPATGP